MIKPKKINKMTLARLLELTGAGAVTVLFVPVALLLGLNAAGQQERALLARGRTVVEMLAASSVDAMLAEDDLALYSDLERAIERDEKMKYAFVCGPHQQTVAHTFESGVPAGLKESGCGDAGGEGRRLRGDGGHFFHVSAPIMDGSLGYVHAGISRGAASAAVRNVLMVMSGGLVLSLAFIFTGAGMVAGAVSNPLRKLTLAVSQYKGKGEMTDVDASDGTAEVAELADGFAAMADRIRVLEKERMAALKRMLRAERMAAAGEMAAGIIHDVRNPLDGMQECVRYLEKDEHKSARAGKFYPMLQDGLERISRVMDDLLATATADAEVEMQDCSVKELLGSIKLMLQTQLGGRSVRLLWEGTDMCLCRCDPDTVIQAATNLVLNASDAAESCENPTVRVESGCDRDGVYICVDDSGPGVPENMGERIFDPFFTTKPKGKGSGLGLSMARRLIRECGGDIELAPDPSPLGGARFVVKLEKTNE